MSSEKLRVSFTVPEEFYDDFIKFARNMKLSCPAAGRQLFVFGIGYAIDNYMCEGGDQ